MAEIVCIVCDGTGRALYYEKEKCSLCRGSGMMKSREKPVNPEWLKGFTYGNTPSSYRLRN